MKNIKKYLIFLSIYLIVNIINMTNIYALNIKELEIRQSNMITPPLSQTIGQEYAYYIPQTFNANIRQNFNTLIVKIEDNNNYKVSYTNKLTNQTKTFTYTTSIGVNYTTYAIYMNENGTIGIEFEQTTGNNNEYLYYYPTTINCYENDDTECGGKIINIVSNDNKQLYMIETTDTVYMSGIQNGIRSYEISGNGEWSYYNYNRIGSYNNTTRIIGSNIEIILTKYNQRNATESQLRNNWDQYKDTIKSIIKLENIELELEKETTGQIESIDIYFKDNNLTDRIKIEETSLIENYNINNYYPTGYYMYGKKCEINTCYWEEVNNNDFNITNDTYTTIENGLQIMFEINVNTSNYEELKLSIKAIPNNIKVIMKNLNFNVIDEYKLDLNQIGKKYSLENYIVENNRIFILIDSKNNNNINYRFYTKNKRMYGGNETFYPYYKNENEIPNKQVNYNTYYGGNYYYETGTINLGNNSNEELLIMLVPMGSDETIIADEYNIYYSDEIYYTKSNTENQFKITINGNTTTINPINNNEFIISEGNNLTKVDFNYFKNIVEEYKQYKDNWIRLFNKIWNPLPEILKTIITFSYFGILCYGIFLIFKD